MSDNRIDELFKSLQAEGKKAFVAYVAAGDPDIPRCKTVVKALAAAGADLIELGRATKLLSRIFEIYSDHCTKFQV